MIRYSLILLLTLLSGSVIAEETTAPKPTATTPESIPSEQAPEDEDLQTFLHPLGGKPTLANLKLAMVYKNPLVRMEALGILSGMNTPEALNLILLAVEKDSHAGIRRAAVEALSSRKDPRMGPALLKALNDSDDHVRQSAILLLAIGAMKNIPALMGPLSYSVPEIRHSLLSILNETYDPEALPGLIHWLNHPDLQTQMGAAKLLGEFGSRAVSAVPALILAAADQTHTPLRLVAIGSLGLIGDPNAVPAVAHALKDPDPTIRQAATEASGQLLSPTHLPALINALSDPDARVRGLASMALGNYGAKSVPFLKNALRDKDSATALKVIQGIEFLLQGHPGYEEGYAILFPALEHPEPAVRLAGVKALTRSHKLLPDLSPLTKLLTDPLASIRQRSVWALGQLHDLSAAPALAKSLNDPSPLVRHEVLKTFEVLKIYTLTAIDAEVELSTHTLADIEVFRTLYATIESTRKALTLLGTDALPELKSAVHQEDPFTRSSAIEILSGLNHPAGLSLLIDSVTRLARESRFAAVTGLERNASPEASLALTRLLDDPDRNVRLVIIQALGKRKHVAGDTAGTALVHLLSITDAALRQTAVRALGQLQFSRAIPVLEKILREEVAEMQTAALEALMAMGPEALPTLTKALHGKDSAIRIQFLQFAHQELLRNKAENADELTPTGLVTRKGFVKLAEEALQDPDARIRLAAAQFLVDTNPHAPLLMPTLIHLFAKEGAESGHAALLLGQVEISQADSTRFTPLLLSLLAHGKIENRVNAALLLGQWNLPTTESALRKSLEDPEPSVRLAAVISLGQLGATTALTQALQDPADEVRLAALDMLGELEDPKSLPALQHVLDDPVLGPGAILIIAAMETEESATILKDRVNHRDPAMRGVALQLQGLNHKDHNVQEAAIATLIKVGHEPAIRQALSHSNIQVRIRTVTHLHHQLDQFLPTPLEKKSALSLPVENILSLLRETAVDPDPEIDVRLAAIDALITATPLLIKSARMFIPLLSDSHPSVREQTVALLLSIMLASSSDPLILSELKKLLQDPDEKVQFAAKMALERFNELDIFSPSLKKRR